MQAQVERLLLRASLLPRLYNRLADRPGSDAHLDEQNDTCRMTNEKSVQSVHVGALNGTDPPRPSIRRTLLVPTLTNLTHDMCRNSTPVLWTWPS